VFERAVGDEAAGCITVKYDLITLVFSCMDFPPTLFLYLYEILETFLLAPDS
jgi:hypothetical protein